MADQRRLAIYKRDVLRHKKLMNRITNKVRYWKNQKDIDISFAIDKPSLDQFTDRKQLNEWYRQAEQFTNRSNKNFQFVQNQHGLVLSQKQLQDAKEKVKKQQEEAIKINEEIADTPLIAGGKKQPTTYGKQQAMLKEGQGAVNIPNDFNFDSYRRQKDLEEKLDNIERRSDPDYYPEKQIQLQENFIGLIEQNYNSDADEVIEKMKQIPADVFFQIFLTIEEVDFKYWDSDNEGGTPADARLELLNTYIEDYKNYIDQDLKGFN